MAFCFLSVSISDVMGVAFCLFGELLSLACPKRRLFYDRSISPLGDHSFLCLSIRKKAKNKTPQLPLDSCATQLVGRQSKTRPDKPHRTWLVAGLKQLLAEIPRQSCVARRGRWGPRTPGERNCFQTLVKESGF